MPLSSKEKTARHRARLKSDPVARAEYLAKRKARYCVHYVYLDITT